MDLDRYRVAPGKEVALADHDPRDTSGFDGDKSDAEDPLDERAQRLAELQHLLYAQRSERVLLVLQGMDTSGKDGTVRRVFREVSPLGVQVANFKAPTDDERAHDYLWRVHRHTPAAGGISVFNRSHYEDVLVVRVHEYVPIKQIDKRYDHINDFERMLVDEGVTIVKCFLHISKDEQRERLQARVDDPTKRWKFNEGDIDERKLWDQYQRAYELALGRCSTKWAPWYVIPSDRKWYRNLVVTELLCQTLEGLKMKWPEPEGVEGTQVV
jgi:PPK2 family polyphosphate:nucleotide phosphotransferase